MSKLSTTTTWVKSVKIEHHNDLSQIQNDVKIVHHYIVNLMVKWNSLKPWFGSVSTVEILHSHMYQVEKRFIFEVIALTEQSVEGMHRLLIQGNWVMVRAKSGGISWAIPRPRSLSNPSFYCSEILVFDMKQFCFCTCTQVGFTCSTSKLLTRVEWTTKGCCRSQFWECHRQS